MHIYDDVVACCSNISKCLYMSYITYPHRITSIICIYNLIYIYILWYKSIYIYIYMNICIYSGYAYMVVWVGGLEVWEIIISWNIHYRICIFVCVLFCNINNKLFWFVGFYFYFSSALFQQFSCFAFILTYVHLFSFIFYVHLLSSIFVRFHLVSSIFIYNHLYSSTFIYIHLSINQSIYLTFFFCFFSWPSWGT